MDHMATEAKQTTGAIVASEHGGPEVLQWKQVALPEPGPDELLIHQRAAGLNYIDVYQRTGLYPMPLPFTPGVEGAGIVEAVGKSVKHFSVGQRVAYATTNPIGAYSQRRVLPASRVVALPAEIDFVSAAGMMLKGCTVEYLVQRTYPVRPGQWVLWHAAAGGVGLMAMQWLRSLGARIIGTVGSAEKAALAAEHGCEHVILYRDTNISHAVRELTDGRGVDVVFDSVGRDTFEASLDSLRPRGMLVSFGNASGPIPAFAPLILSQKGSLYFTRAGFKDYYSTPEEVDQGCAALFGLVAGGKIKVPVRRTLPLSEAAEAHRALEARETSGATVFLID